jgi:hypothetical protein
MSERYAPSRDVPLRSSAGATLGKLARAEYSGLRVLPVVAVQISPGDPPPLLEERLLSACSAGLKRARCIAAPALSPESDGAPRAVAVVSWDDAAHVSVEVGLGSEQPAWIERKLSFGDRDPELERWRAAGFTVALLADDPRFWSEPAPSGAMSPRAVSPAAPAPEPRDEPLATQASLSAPSPVEVDLRGVSGAGLVSGAWRLGVEARTRVAVSNRFFVTAAAQYALASDAEVGVRWFDASVGLGYYVPAFSSHLHSRLRVELLAENLVATAHRDAVSERRSAWIPGGALGCDLIWPLGPAWAISGRVDGFWLDGSSVITDAGERVAVSAGAGILLGLGVSVRF